MISIEKIVQNILQCKDTNLALPDINDNENSKFIQKTAIDIRKEELVCLETTQLNEANYTMDKELERLNEDLTTTTADKKNVLMEVNIPSKALIVYNENETASLPEIINNLMNEADIDVSQWYIYGIKNPEAFYKSFLLLTKMDFIIKNKNEKKNDVATFKREMAIHYETFYKTLNYRKLRFPHHEMVHKLTGIDNYCEYDAVKYAVDYSQTNLIILDIIGNKYIDLKYYPNNLNPDTKPSPNGYKIIVKYVNNIYLPLMNSNGNHNLDGTILPVINKYFERIQLERFKEPDICGDGENVLNGGSNDTSSDITDNLDNNNMPGDGDILNCDEISIFYNNTIHKKTNIVLYEPIIKAGGISFAIEDMIEIEEQENTIIGEKPTIPINEMPIVSVKTETTATTETTETTDIKEDKSVNGFDELMNSIPMRNEIGVKTRKTRVSPKAIKTNTITTEKSTVVDKTETETEKDDTEELKPIIKYKLFDLQAIARFHKVEVDKEGSSGRRVKKTKDEMYNEILEIQNRKTKKSF